MYTTHPSPPPKLLAFSFSSAEFHSCFLVPSLTEKNLVCSVGNKLHFCSLYMSFLLCKIKSSLKQLPNKLDKWHFWEQDGSAWSVKYFCLSAILWVKRQHQRCDDASDTGLIENNVVAPKWVQPHFEVTSLFSMDVFVPKVISPREITFYFLTTNTSAIILVCIWKVRNKYVQWEQDR